ncbi:hypothetical protein [Streptomyces sp. WAC 06738]|uniref:hypothetical protein n=1 Tax=Streptomyces sp. WAC 06738 TaxID=2203210 RepID=UPI000F7B6D2E|nr:hypothetical protein [Streptomyces sp. WAC 06738]
MTGPQHPRVNTQDHGLDKLTEAERPWSPDTGTRQELPCSADRQPVIVEYIVVDGKDAEAVAQRQGAAIREVLEWIYAHRREQRG